MLTQENCDDLGNIGNHIGFSPARNIQIMDSQKRKNSDDAIDLDEDEVVRQAELELAISQQPQKDQRHAPNTERASLREGTNDSGSQKFHSAISAEDDLEEDQMTYSQIKKKRRRESLQKHLEMQ